MTQFARVSVNSDDQELLRLRSEVHRLESQLRYIAKLGDTGSNEHKRCFDPDGIGKVPAGWRVVEAIRTTALDALRERV